MIRRFNLKKFLIVFTAVAVIFFSLIIFSLRTVDSDICLSVKVNNNGGTEEILPWYDDNGTWYFFIPSYAELNNTFLLNPKNNCFLDSNCLAFEQTMEFLEPGRKYSYEQRSFGNNIRTNIVFLKSANVATMFIETKSGNMDVLYASRNNKENVFIRLYSEYGELNYSGSGKDIIKGRGHSSWKLEKKPFNIKLHSAEQLLGMNCSKNWVLLANGYDETNLRNKLIFDFASVVMQNWVPRCEYVDLYLNGKYNGLYLLAEKVEVADSRLSAVSSEHDFLIESTRLSRVSEKDTCFNIDDERYFILNYPKKIGQEDLSEIRNNVCRLDEEICSGNFARINLDSWVRRFLIDEIFINCDAIKFSSFYYYDSSFNKFFAGPIWDYDLSFGNDSSSWTKESQNPQQIWCINRYWYRELYNNPVFYELLTETYINDFLPNLKELQTIDLPKQVFLISEATVSNSIRWDGMFKIAYAEDKEPEQRINELSVFLQERLNYLQKVWLSGIQ